MEFERFLIEGLHVLVLHPHEIFLQADKLIVLLVVVVGHDRDSVWDLVAEGVGCVVYDGDVLEGSALEYAHVLNIDSLGGLNTVVSEEPVVNVLPIGIQIIQHDICVASVRGREYDYLEVLAQVNEDLPCIWSDVDASL